MFDHVLGTRHSITMPHVKEVRASTLTPTQKDIESLLKSGKKREASNNAAEMRLFFQNAEERHEKFLSDLMSKQMDDERVEREKDRKLLMQLFKKDDKE